jgi:PIN domain-containing protein
MDSPPAVIIDACILYSAPIRDLVVRLAQAGLLQARWTNDIHDEWTRNVLKNNPKVRRERLERTRSLLDGALRDCLVTGYSDLVESLSLPDPDDRHVLAAAIHRGAGVILTFNLSDFPPEALALHGVKARHPDELFSELLDAAVDEFCEAARLQRQGLRNPPKSVEEFLATLEEVGLPQTVARLRGYAHRLSRP